MEEKHFDEWIILKEKLHFDGKSHPLGKGKFGGVVLEKMSAQKLMAKTNVLPDQF